MKVLVTIHNDHDNWLFPIKYFFRKNTIAKIENKLEDYIRNFLMSEKNTVFENIENCFVDIELGEKKNRKISTRAILKKDGKVLDFEPPIEICKTEYESVNEIETIAKNIIKNAINNISVLSKEAQFNQKKRSSDKDESWFWDVVDKRIMLGANKAEGINRLTSGLSKLSDAELIKFIHFFKQLLIRANTNEIREFYYQISNSTSDDGFVYFRAWMIMKGKLSFESIPNAKTLEGVILKQDDYEYEFEEVLGVTSEILIDRGIYSVENDLRAFDDTNFLENGIET